MRKGACRIGSCTMNSTPVELRGAKLDPGASCSVLLMEVLGNCERNCAKPAESSLNWLLRRMPLMPASKNNDMETGPTKGMRYSAFPTACVSPPGSTMVLVRRGTPIVREIGNSEALRVLGTLKATAGFDATGRDRISAIVRMSKSRNAE